jgi:PAS domain S-box-containing protein
LFLVEAAMLRTLLQWFKKSAAHESTRAQANVAEDWLQHSEEQFRLLVTNVLDYAIFMLDPTGHVITWNAGAERINGYRAEEIVGQHFSRFYPQEVNARGWPDYELRMAADTGRFEDEGWRVRKDGTQFWANVVITARRDQGVLRGFVKVTRDLSERRRAEEQLRAANAELELHVRNRTEELARINQTLESEIEERCRVEGQLQERVQLLAQADLQKNQFLAMMAHELRNPLAPIRNAIHILKMPGVDAATAQLARDMMERQLHHLVRLVDDLIDVSRIVRGRIELQREPTELMAVLGRATEMAQSTIDAQGHQLILSLPSRSVMLDADVMRLAQVFTNLLINSASYTEKPGRIWLTAACEDRHVLVHVRDEGVGIPADLLPRIFELFVQSDRPLARTQGGLGVGLTVAKQLVEMHGGTITARSGGAGKGSEFVVRLPMLPSRVEAEPEPAPQQSAHLHGPPRRVLVVDDNIDAAESAALLLRMWGHVVQTVHDGLSVLQAVRDFRPEIILLDIGLPGMTGYEVAQLLRAQPESQSVVLAAITGYGQEADKRRSREAGFNVHLTKPLDPTKLEKLIAVPANLPRDQFINGL